MFFSGRASMMLSQHRVSIRLGRGLVRVLGLTVTLGLALGLTLGGLSGCSSTNQKSKDQVNVNSPADKILVKKSEHKLYLLKNGQPIRTYRVSLGSSPKGHKERQGTTAPPRASTTSTDATRAVTSTRPCTSPTPV